MITHIIRGSESRISNCILGNNQIIRNIPFLIVGFLMLFILYSQLNTVLDAIIMDTINTTNMKLSNIDKNLTSTMINMSLTQINDSWASDSEEATINLGMARNTIQDLIIGLSNKSDQLKFYLGDTDLCSDHPIDCMIGRLQFALDSLNRGHPELAEQVLTDILHTVA